MNEAKSLTWGIILGGGLMYLMDPRQGGARRARIRDTSRRAVHEVESAAAVGLRDLEQRRRGLQARLGDATVRRAVDDDVLVERVRTRLGHVASHPHAIRVASKGGGCIELKGPILSREVDRVLSAVAHVRGVTDIDDDLEVHASADGVPLLQGGRPRRSGRARFVPATKLVVGAAAATLGLISLVNGHALGLVAGGAAVLGIARSMNGHGGRSRRLPRLPSSGRTAQVGGRNRASVAMSSSDAEMSYVAMP